MSELHKHTKLMDAESVAFNEKQAHTRMGR